MRRWQIIVAVLVFGFTTIVCSANNAHNTHQQRHIEVGMRMIGHQVLLNSHDSTSRVLPIERIGDRYKIQFSSEFAFRPGDLASTIDGVMIETKLATRYIVEVEQCNSGEVVYSYEVDSLAEAEIIPCLGRDLPKSCYNLMITLLDEEPHVDNPDHADLEVAGPFSGPTLKYILLIVLLLLVVGGYLIARRKKSRLEANPDIVLLGDFRFDKRNIELVINDRKIELTSKEADLLSLLYETVNNTVEREVILNRVWGDEGDYVGRTLDVFISKLRKKLEADAKLKIINIRGIGYKLVVNG
jgi:hypothetical protein